MPKYAVYEVWTKSQYVEADSIEHAYKVGEPKPLEGFSLCNWHIVEDRPLPASGALNYSQEPSDDIEEEL